MYRLPRALPAISLFHNPANAHSKRVLGQLQAALAKPYPSSSEGTSQKPLEFDLEVVESDPTPEQLSTIRKYLKLPPGSESVSASDRPIVVNWNDGVAAAGSGAPGDVLEAIRQKRDGQGSSEGGESKSGGSGGFFGGLFN
ncbi:hypothetical protein BKA62DRAFT_694463 [Auriculariales sp. MPI-PUGE-AT-0066]|nr:hypothetical protein BKA62DRAFT_694463 [Auriculariales sp. MPI-PUGE-AT-0066]